jgi:aspartate/methionine/tyrosine aminotransferase
MSVLRYHAPYMEYAKTRPHARFDLGGSNILACSLDDLPGAREALALSGDNDNGYAPLIDAIAAHYGATPSEVTTATGTAGANFFALAALVGPDDDVLIERPGYDPLPGAARLLGATTVRFDRTEASGFALDPDRVRSAITPRTRAIVVTHPHNPTGVAADAAALAEIGDIAARINAHVIVDEVYRDVSPAAGPAIATLNDVFVTTNSLTKSYGLSSLRCGWVIASDDLTYRVRRVRDVVDGTGSIVAERMATIAFAHLDALASRAHAILTRNKAVVDAFLGTRRELRWAPSAGTVVFPAIEGVDDVSAFVDRLLRERETAIVPGRFFEAPGRFRLGYGGDTERLRGGLERLAAALDGLR